MRVLRLAPGLHLLFLGNPVLPIQEPRHVYARRIPAAHDSSNEITPSTLAFEPVNSRGIGSHCEIGLPARTDAATKCLTPHGANS